MAKPVRKYSTAGMSREEWLEHRIEGIGGSDASVIMGLNQWKSPYALWLEKTGQIATPDLSDNEAVHFGTILEDIVAKEFESRSGLSVARRNAIYAHPDHDFMRANVDRVIVGQNKGLECKTTNAFNGAEWDGDNVPDAYYVQCQHYMAVMGWESCYIACLIGGQRFAWKEIPRNDDFIRELIGKEQSFWASVFSGNPPAITGYDDVSEYYPTQARPEWAEPTEALEGKVKRLIALKQSVTEASLYAKMIENELKMAIGDKAGIKGLCSWKQNKPSKKTDWQAVAEALKAPEELIAGHTEEKPGTRVFKILLKETA